MGNNEFKRLGNPGRFGNNKAEIFAHYDYFYGSENWRLVFQDDVEYLEVKRIPFNLPKDLYFATGNAGKVHSAERSLGNRFSIGQVESLKIAEEQATIPEIAIHKARIAYAVLCQPVICEDTGFFIPSKRGYPGTRVHRELAEKGLDYFLRIARADPRGYVEAYWHMVVGYFDGVEEPKLFDSILHGKLIGQARGNLRQEHVKSKLSAAFIVNGQEKTLAEMTTEEYDEKVATTRWNDLLEYLLRKRGIE